MYRAGAVSLRTGKRITNHPDVKSTLGMAKATADRAIAVLKQLLLPGEIGEHAFRTRFDLMLLQLPILTLTRGESDHHEHYSRKIRMLNVRIHPRFSLPL